MNHVKQLIHLQYGIPVKRGMQVRSADYPNIQGKVTGYSNQGCYVVVNFPTEHHPVKHVHPCSLDYLIDGEWELGNDYCKRLNDRIDRLNEQRSKSK